MLDSAELAQRHSADLLGRAELGEPPTVAARWLANRRVLITGAGGSVGRPLAAAIVQAKPAQLVLLDHHEASLWDLHRRFGGEAGVVNLVPADIRNGPRLAAIFERWRPEVVFHLAAYKHVPFGEVFSDEVFAVNVLATRAILELAGGHGVERFVYPSSDKACDPPSLYGATKRLGEVVVRHTADNTGLPYNVARFVNILGTQGSVIETFAQQIHDRQPLTALRDGGNTLMLDAREEIGVVEMARRVCRLLRGDASACQIAYGTPRAGERLSEQLLSASERFETGARPELLRVCDARTDEHLERLPSLLEQLGKLATLGQASMLREATMAAARELQ
jgi:FlaA1/EpsC-like NDP-sugar epimerase